MALRDQPYLPLFVQDYLTDEKLSACSPAAQGVYIKILCLFHKFDTYGGILLKQKDKQNESMCLNFACKFANLLPFSLLVMQSALEELLDEEVLHIDGDFLYQKRMVRDNEISCKRAASGKNGGKKTQSKHKDFASSFAKAKSEAKSEQITEYEYEYEYEDKERDKREKRGTGEKEKKEKTEKFDFKKSLLDLGVSEKIASDWMKVRKDKKASNTETAFTAISNQITLSGISPDDCVRIAVESSWQGLKAEWILNKIQNNGNSEIQPVSGSVRKNTAGDNAADKKRSVDRLGDMAEAVLQNLVPENV